MGRGASSPRCMAETDAPGEPRYLTLDSLLGSRTPSCQLAFCTIILADWVIPWTLLDNGEALEVVRRLAAVSRLGLSLAGVVIMRAERSLGLAPTPE